MPDPIMRNTESRALQLLLVLIGVLALALFLAAATCSSSSVIERTVISEATALFFDKPVTEQTVVPQASDDDTEENSSEPYAIENLQARLSALDGNAEIDGFGGYLPSVSVKDELNAALSSIVEQDYQVGFLMLDLQTGSGISYNINEKFYSASSIKGVYIPSVVAAEPDALESWSEVMQATIAFSDNDGYMALRTQYGDDPFVQWCELSGADSSLLDDWYPFYSTKSLAKLWLQNYAFFESDSEAAAVCASWYNGSFNSVIHDTLGQDSLVYSKGGWIIDEEFSATIDAGIVYAGERPYLLVIASDAPGDMQALQPLVSALDSAHNSLVGSAVIL